MSQSLNKGQEKALKTLLSGRNVFLTGNPGTGKSFLIKEFIRQMEESGKNCLICAPTGVAAVNIGGVTLHRALHIPVPAWNKKQKINPADSALRALHIADVVIIDEISMCRADVFDYAIKVIKAVEKYMSKTIQIVVVGDFFQLPPVVTKSDLQYLEKAGYDKSGFCFTTTMWKRCKFKTMELTEAMRQADAEFLEILNQARKSVRTCYTYFQKHVVDGDAIPDECIRIYPTVAKANAYNTEKLNKIPGMGYTYFSEITGRITGDKPIEDTVVLKPGCRVMAVVNSYDGAYCNGTMGTVRECYTDGVLVDFDSGKTERVEPYVWQFYDYKTQKGKIQKEVYGKIKQIPLRLAYAITVHKSQGQTFDKAAIDPASFADGQFYVAVSRVSNPEGLFFTGDVLPEYIKTNVCVEKFYENFEYTPEKKVSKTTTKTKAKPKTSAKTSAGTKSVKRKTGTAKKKATAKKSATKKGKTNGNRRVGTSARRSKKS